MQIYNDKTFKDITTFNIGGPIENLYFPETKSELIDTIQNLKQFHIVGMGSKILAGDGPFENVVCTKMLNKLWVDGETIRCETGVYAPHLSLLCAEERLTGTEFLIDIPATIGGAVVMNAGFLGHEMSQICTSVEYITYEGELKKTSDIKWDRRWSSLQGVGVITEVTLDLKPQDKNLIKNRISKYKETRAHQPQRVASAGGIFINHKVLKDVLPKLPYLICGDAEIVENCPNFIVNHGNATISDILHLINLIETHALTKGISMKREIKIME